MRRSLPLLTRHVRRSSRSGWAERASGRWAWMAFGAAAALLSSAKAEEEKGEEERQAGSSAGKAPRDTIPTAWRKYKVIGVDDLSHDTRVLRFELPEGEPYRTKATDTLQIGMWNWDFGELITRHYTPVTPDGTVGYFELIIKLYYRGLITPQLFKLGVGDTVEMRRQQQKFVYRANKWRTFNMIAGGVGITPMLQMIRHALNDPADNTKMNLVFCNKTRKDIILRDELDALQSRHPDRFRVTYVIDRPEPGWTGPTGYLNEEAICRYIPRPTASGSHFLVLCGPDGMLMSIGGVPQGHLTSWSHTASQGRQPSFPDANAQATIGGMLGRCGWTQDNAYIF